MTASIQTHKRLKRTLFIRTKPITHIHVLPSTGQENNTAQPKTDKQPSFPSNFSWFFTISVDFQLDKGEYPENAHVVFCHNKQRSFEPFMCLDLSVLSLRSLFSLSHATS